MAPGVLAQSPWPTRWFEVESNQKHTVAVDVHNVTRWERLHYQTWVWLNYSQPERPAPGMEVYSAMMLGEWRCRYGKGGDEFKMTRMVMYSKAGEVLSNGPVNGTWEPIVPETTGEKIATVVCAAGVDKYGMKEELEP